MSAQIQYPSDYVGIDGKIYPTIGEAFRSGDKLLIDKYFIPFYELFISGRGYNNITYDDTEINVKPINGDILSVTASLNDDKTQLKIRCTTEGKNIMYLAVHSISNNIETEVSHGFDGNNGVITLKFKEQPSSFNIICMS